MRGGLLVAKWARPCAPLLETILQFVFVAFKKNQKTPTKIKHLKRLFVCSPWLKEFWFMFFFLFFAHSTVLGTIYFHCLLQNVCVVY